MLDGNCTNIKVILILSVWGILEEKISRTDREGGRNQANQLKYWNKKVIQRLPYYFSSRDGVGMHLPCLWPDFDILILDVGIVSCFSRKCLNFRFGAFHSFFFVTDIVYQCLMKIWTLSSHDFSCWPTISQLHADTRTHTCKDGTNNHWIKDTLYRYCYC